MNIKPNTAIIDFLTKAYKMPNSVREALIDKHDSIDERNIETFIALLYFRIMEIHEFTSLEQARDYIDTITQDELNGAITNLLAHAVLLTFVPEDYKNYSYGKEDKYNTNESN